MTELEKIAYAKSFIDKLANGINPLDDLPLSETDVASNARLSKCFFYVSDILRQVIENEGVHPAKTTKPQKNEFGLSEEARGKLRASKAPKTVSEISNCLNELIDSETTKQISAVAINQWLVELQLLEATAMPNGKNGKAPTAQGEELGIFTKEKQGRQGTYTVVLFSESAQRFIYDNLDGVIAFVAANAIERSEKKEKKEEK